MVLEEKTIRAGQNYISFTFSSGIKLVLRWHNRSNGYNLDDMAKITTSSGHEFYKGDHLEVMLVTPKGEQIELDQYDSCRQVNVDEIASLMFFASTPQDLPSRLKIFAGGMRSTTNWE